MRAYGSEQTPPPMRRIDWVASPTLPLQPPRSRRELDGFLQALATIPVGDVPAIRVMFAGFEARDAIAEVFREGMAQRPCGDLGQFMLLLSAVGELACPRSIAPLHELIWTADEALLVDDPCGSDRETSCCVFPPRGMIQARAAEMFAWIAAGREDDRLLRVVAEHPSVVTRLAAADAFLFAHKDAGAARERVLAVARPGDASAIGVPRFTRDCRRAEFDAALEAGRCPDHPPRPQEIALPARMRRDGECC